MPGGEIDADAAQRQLERIPASVVFRETNGWGNRPDLHRGSRPLGVSALDSAGALSQQRIGAKKEVQDPSHF